MEFRADAMVHPGIRSIKPYIPGTTIQEAVQSTGSCDFIKIASNENPLGMSPKAARAIVRAIAQAHQYPEKTCMDLRNALSRTLDIPSDWLMIGNGADGIIYAVFMSVIDESDEVIIPEMTFSMYETVVHGMRGRVTYSKMSGYEIDLDDILARISENTKLVVLCNPNNPTGSVLDRDRLSRFVESVPETVLIVYDEAYFDFADPDRLLDSAALLRQGRKNLFILRTFSKIYGLAGVRVGYGIGAPDLVALCHRIRPPFDVSVLAQAAGCAALNDKEFFRRTVDLTNREKRYIYRNLDRMGLEYVESQTNFILIDTGRDCRLIYEGLLKRGLIVRAGLHDKLATHIRITVGKRQHNKRFLDAFSEVLREGAG